jgi:hypothetical protein
MYRFFIKPVSARSLIRPLERAAASSDVAKQLVVR